MKKIIITLGMILFSTQVNATKFVCNGILHSLQDDKIVKSEITDKVDPIIIEDNGDSFTMYLGKEGMKSESGKLKQVLPDLYSGTEHPSFIYSKSKVNHDYYVYMLSMPLFDKLVATRDCIKQ